MDLANRPELSEVLVTAIEATVNPEKWCNVVDLVSHRFTSPAVLLFEYDTNNRDAPITYGSSRFRNDKEAAAVVQMFADGTANDDPRIYDLLSSKPAGRYFSEAELFELCFDADLPENNFRERSLRACGATSRGGVKLNDIGPCMDVISLHLQCDTPHISPTIRTEMAQIAPVLGKALETGRIIRNLTRNYGALLEVFDLLDFSAAICRSDGQIVVANSCFSDLTKDSDAISNENGMARAINGSDQAELAKIIARAQIPNTAAERRITTLTRRSGRRPLVAITAPIRDFDLKRFHSQLTLLLLLDPEDRERINARGLVALGSLSPAEVEVCELLVQGYVATEIAEQRGTKPETARGQVKSVAAKLYCRSRLDLIRLAIATSPPMDRKIR